MEISTRIDFEWTTFYPAFADKLLAYKQNRTELLSILETTFADLKMKYPFDYHGDLLNDIDPFTVFAAFNKGITDNNRTKIMEAIGKRIGVAAPPPSSFGGIPVMNNMLSWFIRSNADREIADVDTLWRLFESAIAFADNATQAAKQTFEEDYNLVIQRPLVSWNITMGLYWIRPFSFINLDGKNRGVLLDASLPFACDILPITGLKKLPDAETYLTIIDLLRRRFEGKTLSVSSFPELSHFAWQQSKEIIADTPKGTGYWLYSPGERAKYWDEFYTNSDMGIGFVGIGDLTQYKDREEMRSAMKIHGDNSRSYTMDSLAAWQFAHDLKIGDIVFAKKGLSEVVGQGVVQSDYIYRPNHSGYKHFRKIKWVHSGSWQHPGQAVMKTLTDITPYTEYVRKLEVLVGSEDIEEVKPDVEIEYDEYSINDFVSEVFMDVMQYGAISTLIKNKKNIILQGAPGVGKTFAAKRLAYSMIGEKNTDRVMMVQFHQSYSYEDFVRGFRPSKDGFELTEGPFYSFCKRAQDDMDRDYFFIIDEINRGNLSKIFGELLMLIENDKRGEQLRLLYSNELFCVPSNVYIIGLMNTADRSLALIDYALRRRFAFFEMKPAFDSEGFQAMLLNSDSAKFHRLVECVKELNEAISKDDALGEGFSIGHSYFCTDKVVTNTWLEAIVTYELLPLLNEYWFDEKTKVQEWAKKLHGTLND